MNSFIIYSSQQFVDSLIVTVGLKSKSNEMYKYFSMDIMLCYVPLCLLI